LLPFLANVPRCVVAIEERATARFWARQIDAIGHEVRSVLPAYVKPFGKYQKNDAADAATIAEAASRPAIWFIDTKRERQQALAMALGRATSLCDG